MTRRTLVAQRRIGILGGSFDPPHLAHLALGRCAMQALALDELRWLPAGAPWQKSGRTMALAADRLAMLTLLLADQEDAVIDTREIDRSGPTYTIDSLRELQAELPDAALFLVIGQDQYAHLHSWRDWPELLDRVTLAVAARDGALPTPPPALAAHPHRITTLAMPRLDIAASDIRARCAAGLGVAPLVGQAVAGYIDQHRLYT